MVLSMVVICRDGLVGVGALVEESVNLPTDLHDAGLPRVAWLVWVAAKEVSSSYHYMDT